MIETTETCRAIRRGVEQVLLGGDSLSSAERCIIARTEYVARWNRGE